jgi:adenylate cyclase
MRMTTVRKWSPARTKLCIATGVAASLWLLILVIHWSGLLQVVELKTLDHRFFRYAQPTQASPDIVLVAIDEPSLKTVGRWPWHRDVHGFMVHYLKEAGARAIVFDILFLEPDPEGDVFDNDFATELRAAGNVFLPFLMSQRPAGASPALVDTRSSAEDTMLAKASMTLHIRSDATQTDLWRYPGAELPIPSLAEAAHGLGFIDLFADNDGTLRHLPVLVQTPAAMVPQLAVAVAHDILGAHGVTLTPHALQLGRTTVPLSEQGRMVLNWHGTLEQQTYAAYSAGAVLQSFLDLQEHRQPLLSPTVFKDKIVFIGATAAGTYDLRVTPLSPYTSGVLAHMTALDNILQQRFLRPAPFWLGVVTLLALCLGTAWSFMLLQRQLLKIGLILGLAMAYYGLVVYAFTEHGVWLELALPEGAIAVTYAVTATVEYLTEGMRRRQLRFAFDKYMSAEVVDEIMRHPEAIKLGGEKREISVFFSDVAGFTTISEGLTPEALVEMLNTYLSAMTDTLLLHRGNVNKYLGDGVMALFGAPSYEPQHATLACYAALDCQRMLAQRQAAWQAQGFPALTTRIGVNSGPLVLGNMGSEKRVEYTVMGDSVNLASRLEGANKEYHTLILLGPRTYELAKDDIEAREVDRIRVKGKYEPVVVYELLGRKGELTPQQQQLVKAFDAGLGAYKQCDFATAQRCFTEALSLAPHDGPTQEYLRRVAEYRADPPPPDWDGVYELKSK